MTTRDDLLRAALHVVGEHGIAGLTNRLVAKRAGVSLGSLTYHFSSQTQLLREALLLFVGEETARITELAAALRDTVQSVEQAAEAAQAIIAEMSMGPAEIGSFEVYVQSARDPELREASRGCYAAYDQVAAAILTSIGVANAGELAPQVVALISGAQLRRLATGAESTGAIASGLLLLVNTAPTSRPPSSQQPSQRRKSRA